MVRKSIKRTIFKNETFEETVPLKDSSKVPFISNEPYLLEEKDYLILTKIKSGLSFWTYGILMCAGGLFLAVAGKYIDSLISNQPTDIKNWELITLVLTILIGFLLKLLSICCPDDRKKLLKKIAEHFKTAKKFKGFR